MKLIFILAIAFTTQALAQSVDIELYRYPLLVSKTLTNQKASNDLETIRYTRVLRWAPTQEKDLSNPLKTYKRNDLANNSLIGISNDYPSWLIDNIVDYNKDKSSSEIIRVFGKAHAFGGTRFSQRYFNKQKGRFYETTRKVLTANGKSKRIKVSDSLASSKNLLTKGSLSSRPTFAFNPRQFDTDAEHILKVNSSSPLQIRNDFPGGYGPKKLSLPLAGKEIQFISSKKNVYKYRLFCNEKYESYLSKCQKALTDHYNTQRDLSPKEAVARLINAENLKDLSLTCARCELEPYFKITDPKDRISKLAGAPLKNLQNLEFTPSMAFTEKDNGKNGYDYHAKTEDVFSDLFAIDNYFEFLKDQLHSPKEFQAMISRIDNRDIPSINFPNNAYATYHYEEVKRFVKTGTRTVINPYAACMLQKVQKGHLKKIISGGYRSLNANFRENLVTCLRKEHPEIPAKGFEKDSLIVKLFENSNHPCSDLILNTGMGLQYGDISSAYTFKTFAPHGTHSSGKCIDVRPMRQTHIDRGTFLEKINHQIKIMKNKDLIKDVDSFIKRIAFNHISLTGLRSSEHALNKILPDLFFSEEVKKGVWERTAKLKKYADLSADLKKTIMGEYINHAIDIHDKGFTNPAVVAYFKYSLTAIDSNFDSIKDENTTNDFIRLLKEEGTDHDTIAYSEGYQTLGRQYHNSRNEKLGLEKTKNWKGHNDHLHFCFDYNKAENQLSEILEAKKAIEANNDYVYTERLNEYLNKGKSEFQQKDYFQGLRNKVECLKTVPSELNSPDKSNEIKKTLDGLRVF